MKPAPFEYAAPSTVDEALALLGEHGDEARVLAGGQSLVPMLNFRLVRPAILIDINRIAEMATIRLSGNVLQLGALVRTAVLARSEIVRNHAPLLQQAAALVGHAAIRNSGTVGGSAAQADPNAELPAALRALDARFRVRSRRGSRELEAAEFFRDFYATALAPDELLAQIDVPCMPSGTRTAFIEHARSHGDFALAGAAVGIRRDDEGRCNWAAIAILGGGATPLRATTAEQRLVGSTLTELDVLEAAKCAAAASDPPDPQDYRRALIAAVTQRAVLSASRGSQA